MEIILLKKVERLGELGDIVRVRPGYARNYLIPSGYAKYATEENRAEIQKYLQELAKRDAESIAALRQRAKALEGFALTIPVETHQEGKLFGSVGANDIAQAIANAGGDIQRQELRMPDGPLRELGKHEVEVHLHADIDLTIEVTVVSSGVAVMPEEEDVTEEDVTEETVTEAAAPEAEEKSADDDQPTDSDSEETPRSE